MHVVATTHPGALAGPFAHDRKVILGVPAAPRVERIRGVLTPALAGRRLHAHVLGALAERVEPSELFAICDALEAAPGGADASVFEPAVERALADLRPVLHSVRPGPGAERTYAIFHPAVAEALRTIGGAP